MVVADDYDITEGLSITRNAKICEGIKDRLKKCRPGIERQTDSKNVFQQTTKITKQIHAHAKHPLK